MEKSLYNQRRHPKSWAQAQWINNTACIEKSLLRCLSHSDRGTQKQSLDYPLSCSKKKKYRGGGFVGPQSQLHFVHEDADWLMVVVVVHLVLLLASNVLRHGGGHSGWFVDSLFELSDSDLLFEDGAFQLADLLHDFV